MLANLLRRLAPTETTEADPPAGDDRPPRRRRRGATAMEYLVVATFILVALIAGVQHLARIVGDLAQHDADATSVINNMDTGR